MLSTVPLPMTRGGGAMATLGSLAVFELSASAVTAGPGAIAGVFVHDRHRSTEDFLQGLTCERLVPKTVKGFQVLTWEKPSGARNEPLDLCVYALAMLELVKRRYNRATMWDQLSAAAEQQRIKPDKPKQRRRRASQSGPGFVEGW